MAKNLPSSPSSTSHDDQHEHSSSGARTSKSDHERPSTDTPSGDTFQESSTISNQEYLKYKKQVDRVVKKKDKQGLRTVTWKHTFEPVEALMRPDVGSAVKAELRELLRDRDSKDKGGEL
ncbi:unnamed protein product [Zymoseptoria tritici ST99CH_3D1]|nr:unnamed protein product [Zymoseptoria tritici ST99CH_3D1]